MLYTVCILAVVTFDDRYCCQTPGDRVILTQTEGLISNYMTAASGCGSTGCPWVVEALPGQMINISLFDFGTLKVVSEYFAAIMYQSISHRSIPLLQHYVSLC